MGRVGRERRERRERGEKELPVRKFRPMRLAGGRVSVTVWPRDRATNLRPEERGVCVCVCVCVEKADLLEAVWGCLKQGAVAREWKTG